MGLRTRLRVEDSTPSTSAPPNGASTSAPIVTVRETSVRGVRGIRDAEAPQVHLSHGRALVQELVSAPSPQPTTSNFGAVIDAAPPEVSPSKHAYKRQRTFERWEKLLPELVKPYTELLCDTESLRNPASMVFFGECCQCCRHSRQLTVDVVRFNKFERISLWASDCNPAAHQLIRSGLFPCAPVHPTLAVDILMLDFVTRLFLRVSPNCTAWCGTLEDYLRSQGHKLVGQDPLRRRFGNALQWFNSLQAITVKHVKTILEETRAQSHNDSAPGPQVNSPTSDNTVTTPRENTTSSDFGPMQNASADFDMGFSDDQQIGEGSSHKRPHSSDHMEHMGTDRDKPPPNRPSEYLRARCPVCFGGKFDRNNKRLKWTDVIVCLDANFTQRHRTSKRDPGRKHPDSFFLDEDEVQEVESRVNRARDKPNAAKKAKTSDSQDDDLIEPGMRVSRAVLDGCGNSFTAAQESVAKVVASGYDVTGLMAILCRHDHPLFVVNMTTPGERQHYAIALLEKLFKHLPDFVEVGLLYDIACHLERSCFNWGFLEDYMDRLTFAISVFHAFGHQWACQVVYHPRKCLGFGLSDGEGAERLWNSIQRLIAYTRVAGYHLRLYTLDSQLHFGNQESLLRMGTWIRRKLRLSSEKRSEHVKILEDCGIDMTVLREQWKKQVSTQTQPLPSQSKNKGKHAVKECIRLHESLSILKKKMKMLEDTIISTDAAVYKIVAARVDLPKVVDDYNKATDKLRKKEALLGVGEKTQLRRLINNTYIQKSANARALKCRLRQRLQAHKFEFGRLERCYRKKRNDQRLDDHTNNSVKRRDPGIQQLAQKYNKLVGEMRDLIITRKAPRNAVAPDTIDTKNLFSLDVDDAIWQDIGLTYDEGPSDEPPPWLADENIRKGIRSMLEVDRCDEEDERLGVEMRSLQEWFKEKWEVVERKLEETGTWPM
ncbi:hypothetical protein K435DRAFT_682930 [Dendrothele bispora CBS 962.96]|uniref:CxC1-like cysteine cluster associated with KDZ transposases domain-containing protein n=1 Tax=Dendrothele bispora (strain CBS 962.96) TaxID=1314807 RepID=A0A4S8LDJ8_DENBC|nr:hypothetical protein K435DRAFT_682930 [Dendrothele bispora CBS 962.96]